MQTVNELLNVARREIGYREAKDKSNKYGRWYGMDKVAWCVEFVMWCADQAGVPLPTRTASCTTLKNAAKATGQWVTKTFKPGDLIIFDFQGDGVTDHIGICESVTKTTITTIDGNTTGNGKGSESNGGCVNRRTRNICLVNGAVRPLYLEEDEELDISKLTNKECYEIIQKAQEYARTLSAPDWAKAELAEAKAAGITDGENPLAFATRQEAAIMCNRIKK